MLGRNNKDDSNAPPYSDDNSEENKEDTLEAIACARPLAVVTHEQAIAAPSAGTPVSADIPPVTTAKNNPAGQRAGSRAEVCGYVGRDWRVRGSGRSDQGRVDAMLDG